MKLNALLCSSLASLFLLAHVAALPSPLAAQQSSGEIAIEDTSTKRRSYSDVTKETTAYFKLFSSQIKGVGQSTVKPLPQLDQDQKSFLAAAYLYCALKKGVCESILDAILETDAYNSALNAKASCPNMSGFWKAWVDADMEKRLGYELNLGLMQKVNQFKKLGRPKYIKCKNTITDLIANAGGAQGFLADRYKPGTKARKRGDFMVSYLDQVDKQVGNVFSATNTKSGRRRSGGGGFKGNKRPRQRR